MFYLDWGQKKVESIILSVRLLKNHNSLVNFFGSVCLRVARVKDPFAAMFMISVIFDCKFIIYLEP